jgi:putative two-component system response regulator
MSERILVVDDDPHVRRVLESFLLGEGYEPVLAANGEEAIEAMDEQKPDLVLLDAELHGLDGLTVCRRIKNDPTTALIPVTILTAIHEAGARTRAIEAGADDVMSKPVEYPMLRARLRTQLRIKRLTDALESTESVIFAMARWVEVKDPYTEGHLRRIAGYSEQTARALGLSPAEVRIVRCAGILHDIGKIGVHDSILGKPGPLDADEERELRRHAEYGAAIVQPMRFAAEVGPIILGHHEHWDGGGYPHGLVGDDIPLGARIIAVVDAWDAMTSDRPYRRSLGDAEASRRLRAGAGTQWDPRVVEVFMRLHAQQRLAPADLPDADLYRRAA